MSDFLKGMKTVIFGAILVALGSIQQTDLVTVIPPEYVGLAMALIGGVVWILRAITTGPVGPKK